MVTTNKVAAFFFRDRALSTSLTHSILYILFFCSGLSALIYQLMWERMLFTEFGVDIESITIIVSVFMFGLGVGGWLGGYLADKMAVNLLGLYAAIEIGIAGFGFLSPDLINAIGRFFFTSSQWATVLASFLILAIPTILMGSTFPLLVTHVNRSIQHIGHSVGNLYVVNTLGGAAGAYFAGFVLLYTMTIVDIIQRAAMLNVMIAVIAILAFRKRS